MTWGILIFTIIFSIIKILMTCLPTGVVEWIDSKFKVHKKLNESDVTITFKGTLIDEVGKTQVIDFYNNGIMIEKYYIWPGTEGKFLDPGSGIDPLKIHCKSKKGDIILYLFDYNTHVDVVKQNGKNVVAYSLYPKDGVFERLKGYESMMHTN
jgi:hypothetical protein